MKRRLLPEQAAFTLIELLVSMVVLTVLLLVLVSLTDATSRITRSTGSEVGELRSARNGFETMTRRLSQATLNTYWGYDNPASPAAYLRQSELRYINGPMSGTGGLSPTATRLSHGVFFQAPLGFVADDPSAGTTATTNYAGLENLLNTFGYYVDFGSDANPASPIRPAFLTNRPPPRYRFRLMELMESSQNFCVYNYTSGIGKYAGHANDLNCVWYSSANPITGTTGLEWFTISLNPPAGTPSRARVLAENIVALFLLPRLSPQDEAALTPPPTQPGTALAPGYRYDSTASNVNPAVDTKNQLPPVVQVTMVAVDEPSYMRLQGSSTVPPTLFASTMFQTVGDLVSPANPGYAQDMRTLQNTLVAKKLNFRVFSTDVVMKSAKWSRSQKN